MFLPYFSALFVIHHLPFTTRITMPTINGCTTLSITKQREHLFVNLIAIIIILTAGVFFSPSERMGHCNRWPSITF